MSRPRFNARFDAAQPRSIEMRLVRPGTEVLLVRSGVPPIRGVVTGVILSAGGYRAAYTVVWWEGSHRMEQCLEPFEIGLDDDQVAESTFLRLRL